MSLAGKPDFFRIRSSPASTTTTTTIPATDDWPSSTVLKGKKANNKLYFSLHQLHARILCVILTVARQGIANVRTGVYAMYFGLSYFAHVQFKMKCISVLSAESQKDCRNKYVLGCKNSVGMQKAVSGRPNVFETRPAATP